MSAARCPSRPDDTAPQSPREPDIVLPFATTTSTPTPANETDTISGGSWITPAYDADGNLTTGAAGNTYIYDAWNRLISVTNASSVVLASYAYDGLGRCITETNTTGTYDYYYNESNQVVETDIRTGTGEKVYQQFVWDPRAADTPLEMTQFNADGYATNSYFYMQDANGNVTGLVDGTGAVVERYAYDAYGNVTVYSGNSWSTTISASAVGNPILYQGMQWDAATGLYRTPNRYYSPTLQTWISRDPAGYLASGADLYGFVGGNPISRRDSTGLQSRPVDQPTLTLTPAEWQTTGNATNSLNRSLTLAYGGQGAGQFQLSLVGSETVDRITGHTSTGLSLGATLPLDESVSLTATLGSDTEKGTNFAIGPKVYFPDKAELTLQLGDTVNGQGYSTYQATTLDKIPIQLGANGTPTLTLTPQVQGTYNAQKDSWSVGVSAKVEQMLSDSFSVYVSSGATLAGGVGNADKYDVESITVGANWKRRIGGLTIQYGPSFEVDLSGQPNKRQVTFHPIDIVIPF